MQADYTVTAMGADFCEVAFPRELERQIGKGPGQHEDNLDYSLGN